MKVSENGECDKHCYRWKKNEQVKQRVGKPYYRRWKEWEVRSTITMAKQLLINGEELWLARYKWDWERG